MVGVEEGDAVASPRNAGAEQERRPDVRRKTARSGSPQQQVESVPLGREQKVKKAIPIVVGGRGAPHPGGRFDAPFLGALGKGPDPIVRKDLDGATVIHHQEVHIPVVVPVREQREEAAPGSAGCPGFLGYIREIPAAVIPIEAVRSTW